MGTSTDPIRYALVDTAARWRLDLSGLPREAMEPFPGAEADLTRRRWSPAVAALVADLTALALYVPRNASVQASAGSAHPPA